MFLELSLGGLLKIFRRLFQKKFFFSVFGFVVENKKKVFTKKVLFKLHNFDTI